MSARYRVRWTVPAEVVVEVEADDQESAESLAADIAAERLEQVQVYVRGAAIFAEVDGIAPSEIEEVPRGRE